MGRNRLLRLGEIGKKLNYLQKKSADYINLQVIVKICQHGCTDILSNTGRAILAGYKKGRYLIVNDKVIITALIIVDEEENFILDFRTLFQ